MLSCFVLDLQILLIFHTLPAFSQESLIEAQIMLSYNASVAQKKLKYKAHIID